MQPSAVLLLYIHYIPLLDAKSLEGKHYTHISLFLVSKE